MMAGELMPRQGGLASEKIRREHRERLAIVYVRQSTVQQIERHQESTRLQYALVDRAFHLGWARENIVVIDEGSRQELCVAVRHRRTNRQLDVGIPYLPWDSITSSRRETPDGRRRESAAISRSAASC